MGNGLIYDSRLSNGPIESINRKVNNLKNLVVVFATLNILETVFYTQQEASLF